MSNEDTLSPDSLLSKMGKAVSDSFCCTEMVRAQRVILRCFLHIFKFYTANIAKNKYTSKLFVNFINFIA